MRGIIVLFNTLCLYLDGIVMKQVGDSELCDQILIDKKMGKMSAKYFIYLKEYSKFVELNRTSTVKTLRTLPSTLLSRNASLY